MGWNFCSTTILILRQLFPILSTPINCSGLEFHCSFEVLHLEKLENIFQIGKKIYFSVRPFPLLGWYVLFLQRWNLSVECAGRLPGHQPSLQRQPPSEEYFRLILVRLRLRFLLQAIDQLRLWNNYFSHFSTIAMLKGKKCVLSMCTFILPGWQKLGIILENKVFQKC